MSRSGESVHQPSMDSADGTFVNVRIGSVQIAQRFRETVMPRFEDKPFVARAGSERPIYRKSKLEGHIESWRWRRIAVNLDSRQIVKRVSASSNQLDNSLEPSFRARNFNCRSRSQSERAQASHKGQIETLVTIVVRNVEECGLLLSARAHRASALKKGHASELAFLLRLRFTPLVGEFRDSFEPFPLISLARAFRRRSRVFEIPYVSAKSSAVGNGVVITTRFRMT